MFDWDDQELADIIWGEGREAEDHIVPYPEDIEKKVLDYCDNSEQKRLIREGSESAEKNPSTSKVLDGSGKDKSDAFSVSGGAVVNSQLEMRPFSAPKSDEGGIAKKSQLDIDLETSRNHHEDKELGDLVGNSWVSIASFDDLDRIFSNDDLDGNTSLGSTDELWSSPNDLLSGPTKSSSTALGSTSWDFGALGITSTEINSEFLRNENSSLREGRKKGENLSSYSRQTIGRNVEREEYAVGISGLVEDKIGVGMTAEAANDSHIENIASPRKSTTKEKWSKIKSKQDQVNDGRPASRLLSDIYNTWPSSAPNVTQFGPQCPPTTLRNYPSSFPSQQSFSQDFTPIPYQHFSTQYGGPYPYINFSNQHQSILASSEPTPRDVISLENQTETSTKPTKMTPEEKIEKLRRRQQMRALLAIKKQQQQQLGHQASSRDQVQHVEKNDQEGDEILCTLPCYDPGSPNKGDDSSTISNIDDYSVEDTVLYHLQDIISRLDMKIRLCIRDSLYRLAQSATQRHYASDASRTKRSVTSEYDVAKEETRSHDRVGSSNLETETNHIDRAVAHLLFHRPIKLPTRHVETPESSTSTKVSVDQEPTAPQMKETKEHAK